MSVTIDMSERALKAVIFKFANLLTGMVLLVATGLSFFMDSGQQIAVHAVLIAVAFAMATNGFLAFLKIIDWFEARRERNNV